MDLKKFAQMKVAGKSPLYYISENSKHKENVYEVPPEGRASKGRWILGGGLGSLAGSVPGILTKRPGLAIGGVLAGGLVGLNAGLISGQRFESDWIKKNKHKLLRVKDKKLRKKILEETRKMMSA
jgi:hypothetical protein